MANNGQFDPVASWAKLSERVENQGKDIVDLRSNMNSGFQSINANLATLSNELRAGGKTQWPVIWSAIGVSFAIIVAIGGLAYAPVTSGMARVESSIGSLSERMITRQEMDWRQARSQEDRLRAEASITDLRSHQVPRGELDRVFESYDSQLRDKQRQLDDIKAQQAGIYGARDAMLDMRERLDRLERSRITAPR